MTSNGVFTGCSCSSRWLFALKRRVATAYLFPLGILIIHYVTSVCMGHAEGFVSVDCGAPAGEYRDSKTTIEWVSDTDSGFASGLQGEGVSVAEAVHAPADISKFGEGQSLNSVRYFPGEQSKYCYVFSQDDYPFIRPGTAFLVRATFWAANLDFGATTTTNTTFQLLINADIWDDVSITLPQSEVVVKEAYLLPTNNTSPPSISVCLAGRGANSSKGIPFISTLELRLLPPEFTNYYLSDFGLPMHCIYTVNYGAAPNDVIRYPDDHIDRIWQPDTSSHPQTTTREIDWQTLQNAAPPPKVLRTAYVEDEQIMLILPVPKGDHLHYYVAEYILDVSGARQSGQRVFTWQTTGYDPNSTVDLFDHDQGFITLSPGIDTPLHAEGYGYLAFNLTKAPNSTYGPLINALQLFREFGETVSPGTYIEDVDAINFIRTKHFTSLKSWSGDPCLPYPYNWLNCTHDLESPTRVSHLLMSNKSLEGTLPPKINSLQALVGIYLARNKLSGDIPDLRNLDQLQTLYAEKQVVTHKVDVYAFAPHYGEISFRRYAEKQVVTHKVDVYAFGAVLLLTEFSLLSVIMMFQELVAKANGIVYHRLSVMLSEEIYIEF